MRITPEDLDKTRFIVSDKNEFLSANQSESEEIESEIMESLQKHEARIAQLQQELIQKHPEQADLPSEEEKFELLRELMKSSQVKTKMSEIK